MFHGESVGGVCSRFQFQCHRRNGRLGFFGDRIHGCSSWKGHGIAHDQGTAERDNQGAALGQVAVQAIEVDGNDRNVRVPGSQVPYAALEIRHYSRYASRAFREKNKTVALPKHGVEQFNGVDVTLSLVREMSTALTKFFMDQLRKPERPKKSGPPPSASNESGARARWSSATWHQVAVVVGDVNHVRRGEVLGPHVAQADDHPKNGAPQHLVEEPKQPAASIGDRALNNSASMLPGHASKLARGRHSEKVDEVKKRGCRRRKSVQPVQVAPVPRDGIAGVFDAQIAFDARGNRIPHEARHGHAEPRESAPPTLQAASEIGAPPQ